MKFNFLIICLVFNSLIVKAQTDFRPGYVIDFSGDTLYGEIDYRGDLLMGSVCKLKITEGEIIEYSPYDIAAFRFIDSKYFVSKEIPGKMVFLEYLINGIISVYYLRDDNGDHYYIEKEGLDLTELPYEEGTKSTNLQKTIHETLENEEIVYSTTYHMGLLKVYMQDYPEIFQRIEDLKKPDHAPLIKLAEKYHYGVCPDEQCLIYEKELPLLMVSVEPYWAIYTYNGSFDYLDNNLRAYGSNIYISIPRANEKLSFKFGIENMNSYSGHEFYDIRKFPFQMQYMYPAKRFKPKVSYGFNLWSIIYNQRIYRIHNLCFNAGFNCELTNRMSLSLNIETEVTSLTYAIFEDVDMELLSGSLKLGLYFDLF